MILYELQLYQESGCFQGRNHMLHPCLQNRVDLLFTYLIDGSSVSYLPRPKKVFGWVWECDASGNFSFCSPEVIDALGFHPDDFLGQPLTEFGLHKSSGRILRQALSSKRFPLQVELEYQTPDHQSRRIKLYVLRIPGTNGHQPRWRGFAQVIEKTDIQPKVS